MNIDILLLINIDILHVLLNIDILVLNIDILLLINIDILHVLLNINILVLNIDILLVINIYRLLKNIDVLGILFEH